MNDSTIYREAAARPGPRRPASSPFVEPAQKPGRRSPVLAAAPAGDSIATGGVIDESLLAILDAPARECETVAQTFQRKESEIIAVCAPLSLIDAHALRKRLATPQPGDRLAQQFARLVVERRTRIINYLADARRRAALAGR